jgi:predicted short-subunit dehydrogenase-like oxidoreductase (DUF2520 family)
MNEHEKQSVTIIGTGSVGTALLDFFKSAGYPILSASNSTTGFPRTAEEIGSFVFITTKDDLISAAAAHLSRIRTNWSNKTVVHCSGNFSSDLLSGLYVAGAATASMHPIQTFRPGDDRTRFQGITISLEGDDAAVSKLIPVVQAMGASPLTISGEQKQVVHLAAVMASNYLVSLLDIVEELLRENDIENGLEIVRPLIEQTVQNVFERGTTEALSGPIARGDSGVIQTHLGHQSLKNRKLELYKLLGIQASDIAERKGSITRDQAEKLRIILQ